MTGSGGRRKAHTPSLALARSLLEDQLPELRPIQLNELGTGWDNTAYRVNGTHVARFPRRAAAAGLLAIEHRVLPRLALRLPLAIPVPEHRGRPGRGYPWEFLVYREIPGRTACAAQLGDDQRRAAAPVVARFLRELHAIDPEEAASWGAPEDGIGRLDVERRRAGVLARLDELVRLGLADDAQDWRDIVDAAAGLTPRRTTLVHGDLYARHLVVDATARVRGVIDWGDVHRGDAAVDLAIAFTFLPPSARGAFFQVYGEIDAATRRLARFRALDHSSRLVPHAVEVGDGELLREASSALRFLAAD